MKFYKTSLQNFLIVRGSTHKNGELVIKSESKKILSQQFSLCTWNAFKGLGGMTFKDDLHEMVGQHDILCLQEVILCDESRWHDADIPSDFVFCANYLRRDGLTEGLMIATSFHNERSVGIPSIFKEPLAQTSKLAMVTFFPIEGSDFPLMLINLHSTLIRSRARFERELQNILDKLPSHEGPIIFCGDFNTLSAAYLQTCEKTLAELGLKLCHPSNEQRAGLKKLDHVFVRGITVDEIKILFSVKSSDHYPISVKFRLS